MELNLSQTAVELNLSQQLQATGLMLSLWQLWRSLPPTQPPTLSDRLIGSGGSEQTQTKSKGVKQPASLLQTEDVALPAGPLLDASQESITVDDDDSDVHSPQTHHRLSQTNQTDPLVSHDKLSNQTYPLLSLDELSTSCQPCSPESEEGDDGISEGAADLNDRPSKSQCVESVASAKAKAFLALFKKPEPRELDAEPRKLKLNKPPVGARGSKRKQGSRKDDVAQKTLRGRPAGFPGEGLSVKSNQLYCGFCSRNIASAKQKVEQHIATHVHKDNKADSAEGVENAAQIQRALEEFEEQVAEQNDGASVAGLVTVAEETKVFRAEFLEQWLGAGIVPNKADKMRLWIQRRCGHTLVRSDDLVCTYISPLRIKKRAQHIDEFEGEDVGVYHDGTTHSGESFAIILRACPDDGEIFERAARVHWFRGSLMNKEIIAVLITTVSTDVRVPLTNVLCIGNDDCSPNSLNYENLEPIMPYSDHEKCSPHTGNHVGGNFDTPTLDDFLKDYNVMVSKSNYAKVYYKEVTGHTLNTNGGSIR